jgi:tol-pal system protein YbgF
MQVIDKRLRRAAGVGVLALASLALGSPVSAASKEMERLLIQVANLQQQVGELQRLAHENTRAIQQLGELVGEQNASVKKAMQDQKLQDEAMQTTLREVSERLSDVADRASMATAIPASAVPAADGSVPAAGLPPTAAPDPRDLFSQAYADCSRGNYDLGIQGFREFLRAYPSTDRSDNAQYWIGECLFSKGAFAEAVEAWDALLRDFPSSDKVPDARVKKGLALEKVGRKKEALVLYRYVLEHYPNSEAAKTAKSKLNPQ